MHRAQIPPRPGPVLGSMRGTLTSRLTSPEGSQAPRPLSNAAQTFSVSWPWQGAWKLALAQIPFLVLRNVPRVTLGVERQLPHSGLPGLNPG